jgi:hypothetical protein
MTYDIQNTQTKGMSIKFMETEGSGVQENNHDESISTTESTSNETQDNDTTGALCQVTDVTSPGNNDIFDACVFEQSAGQSTSESLEPFEEVSSVDVTLLEDCNVLVRSRPPRQSDMYTTARGILQGKFSQDSIGDVVDVIRGYHGSALRDETGVVKLEVTDAVRAVLGSGCSTALARLIVATIYPKATEID